MSKRAGRKSAAQTPAPKSEQIRGSKKNPQGSAASEKSASKIKLSASIIESLQSKLSEFKKSNPSKKNITLNDLKAVYRRGAGAYSSTHRPTISGGKPNTRNAWAMARVNKFLKKAAGEKVKKAYVQDDDLLENGGMTYTEYAKTQFNEEEDRYLPSGYLGEFVISENKKGEYPILYIIKHGYEYRLKSEKDSSIGVFDSDKQIGYADNKAIQVAPAYQKKGIGLQLVTILKERNPNHRFGSMTPEGFNLMGKYYDVKIASNKFTKGGLIAPNGKRSNLTHEQWHLVRTPEFKAWFGDWENDPENASKVVDENGEPLVVYHGTYAEEQFMVFDFYKAVLGFHFGTYKQAVERSNRKFYIKGYKSIVNPYFLNIRKLFQVSDAGEWEYPQKYIDMFISDNIISEAEAKKNGFFKMYYRNDNLEIRKYLLKKYKTHVGFSYENEYEGEGVSYIALEPNQIKLADGSNTTFDPSSPDIRYEDGGIIDACIEEVVNIVNAVQKVQTHYVFDGKLVIVFEDDLMVYSMEKINYHINEFTECHDVIDPEANINYGENYKSIYFNLKQKHENTFENGGGLSDCVEYVKQNKSILANGYFLDLSKFSKSLPSEVKLPSSLKFTLVTYNSGGQKDLEVGDTINSMELMKKLSSFLNLDFPPIAQVLHFYRENAERIEAAESLRGKNVIIVDRDKIVCENISVYEDGGDILMQDTVQRMDNPHLADISYYLNGGYMMNDKGLLKSVYPTIKEILSGHGVSIDESYGITDGSNVSYIPYFAMEREGDMVKKVGVTYYDDAMEVLGEIEVEIEDDGSIEVEVEFPNWGINEEKNIYAKGGMLSDEEKKETYNKWKSLVNMSKSELKRFYDSEEGKVAGLSASEAKAQGIDSGRESARWIMKMKDTPVGKWTPAMWRWAKKQISFISRMSGNKGKLYDDKGRKTRKHLSLLIWGHNPEKMANGGNVKDDFVFDPQENTRGVNALGNLEIEPLAQGFKTGGLTNKKRKYMNNELFDSLPQISTINAGDVVLISESVFDTDGKFIGERMIKAAIVGTTLLDKVNYAKLFVLETMGDGFELLNTNITRPINNIMKRGRMLMKKEQGGVTSFKGGGELNPDNKEVKEYFAHGSGNAGGVLVGKRHSEGGIKAINKSTGQPLEMEGGEVVITRGAVSNPKKYSFDGKEMTTREILSKLNVDGGGVSFAEGGDVPEKMNCGCDAYNFGGQTMKLQDFITMSEKEYQEGRLIAGIEKERKDHFYTLAKLNSGAISVEQALREIASKEMMIDPKYPFAK